MANVASSFENFERASIGHLEKKTYSCQVPSVKLRIISLDQMACKCNNTDYFA